MKAFICSLVILSVMVIFIIINSVFTARYSDEMIILSDKFPKDSTIGAQAVLDSLSDYFSKKEFLIMTTNNHSKVHEIHKIISQLQAAIIADDFSQYSQARLALYDAIRVLAEFNEFSFSEIF